MALEPGDVVDGKYRVVRLIGQGGMGAVYEGLNTRINRRVAIKALHASFAADPEITQRFEREAQAAGRIGNDHILEVLDLGELPGGDHYMVMEYLEGETLGARIRQKGRLSEREAIDVMSQLLAGLKAAHEAEIVHRDLKPDNIFLLKSKANRTDFVKIIDFGISKFQALNKESGSHTRLGQLLGSPYYMSPEQASGNATGDARSDLYSAGVILYEAVTGRVPYDAQTLNQLMFKIVLANFVPPQDVVPGLDPNFGSIVAKAMAKDPAHRFQSADDFSRALEAWAGSGTGVTIPPVDTGGKLVQQAVGASSIVAAGSSVLSASTEETAWKTSAAFSASQTGTPPPKNQAALAGALGIVMTLGAIGVGAFLWSLKSTSTAPEEGLTVPAAPMAPQAPATAPKAEGTEAKQAKERKAEEPIVAPVVATAEPAPVASAEESGAKPEIAPATPPKPATTPKSGAAKTPTPPATSTPKPVGTGTPQKKKKRDFGY